MPATLVIAPHPDDASIGAGGLVLQRPGEVTIVHVTAGDGFWRDAAEINLTPDPSHADFLALGEQRIEESQRAARILSVPPGQSVVLGFPDGQISELVNSPNEVVTSRHTGVSAVPYSAALAPGAKYTGGNLQHQLAHFVFLLKPDIVAFPSTEDHNPDHRAIGILMKRILGPAVSAQLQISYLVHQDLYPGLPWGLRRGRILTPNGLPKPWYEVTLTAHEQALKKNAIAAHRTQMLAMRDWLLGFVAVNEPFHKES